MNDLDGDNFFPPLFVCVLSFCNNETISRFSVFFASVYDTPCCVLRLLCYVNFLTFVHNTSAISSFLLRANLCL